MIREQTMLRKVVILSLLGCFLRSSSVTGILTININVTNGVLTVCPGEFISITCSHDNTAGGVTRWEVSGTITANCVTTVSHIDNAPDDACGLLTITMISGPSGSTFSSTAQTIATEALNGAMVQCFSSGVPNSQVGNVTINVLGIPTPNISSVEQVSQSVVRVNMSVTDTQCVDSFQVEATPVGGFGTTNTTSPTPTVNISDLDVCKYNYILVASAFTAGGIQSEPGSQVSFSADLSVVNGITVTINQEDPLIEWVQMDNPLYPTCISGYFVDSQTGLNSTANFTARSLNALELNTVGFPYCTTIRPTVTPITLMGPLMTVSGNESTSLIDPDFPIPMFSREFPFFNLPDNDTGVVVMRVSVENVSESVVPTRNYQYTTNSTVSPMMSFSGDYFEIELPLAVAGQVVTVTVVFQNGPCQAISSVNYTVPSLEITIEPGRPTENSLTNTIILPLTEYQPEQLLIISTVEPSDDGPIMANYTSPSMQYTVTFTDLDPATEYTFTIRIVLRSNNTVDVVPAVTGTFMTLMMTTTTQSPTTTPTTTTTTTTTGGPPSSSPQSCGIGCIVGIIIGVVVLIVVVVVVIISMCVWKSSKRSKKVKISSHEMADQPTHTLTAADGNESDPDKTEPPSSDTIKSPTPEDSKSEGADGASGTTGGEKENLIYADLDHATKGKKPKPQDASLPTGVAGKEEDVQYATITPTVDKKEEP